MTPKIDDIKDLQYDGKLTIATGKSRKETSWKNKDTSWRKLLEKLSETTRTHETADEYRAMTKAEQDEIKDVGGFVGGTLKGGRRKSETVAWRHVLTLDADFVKGNLWAAVTSLLDCAACIYSTHKHSPDKPRLRLVIPLSRSITAEEYQAVSRKVADWVGIDFFDDTTYEPHRLMYWPSTSKDAEYVFRVQDEPFLDPDEVLAEYEDWRDPSYWPESSRVKQNRQKLADKQGDPTEKPGMVGAFCRTYTISEAIDKYLSDVYEESGDGRYSYADGSTTGGLVVYDDLFAYSHHGTDPAGGQLSNAFDLVRLHLFGAQDEDEPEETAVNKLPSFKAMSDMVVKDKSVKRLIGQERVASAILDFDDEEDTEEAAEGEEPSHDWISDMEVNQYGQFKPTARNVKLILKHDEHVRRAMAVDQFARRITVLKDLPWRKLEDGEYWDDVDDSGLRNYISDVYGIKGAGVIRDAFNEVVNRLGYHPIRSFLQATEWDGLDRLDTLFADYLGAEDTPLNRAITRKSLVAAVRRIFEPGCKYDQFPVLVGPQGVGKSYLLSQLGGRWFNDSLSTVQGKEAYEQLLGSWIFELGELSATKKSDVEALKLFLSKQRDSFRPAYGHHVVTYDRQCVFFGTTNDTEFLRDKTGNRRFWPIRVGRQLPVYNVFTDLDHHEVAQIWAEAKHYYDQKETLYISGDLLDELNEVQEYHVEESVKRGQIEDYLDVPITRDWYTKPIDDRRQYISDFMDGGNDFGEEIEPGDRSRDKVCAMEVWVELFNKRQADMRPIDAREINDILRTMDGWEAYEKSKGRLRFGNSYGPQRAFIRSK